MAFPLRWLAPAALALGLGTASLALPAPARADDELVRVLVDVADVIFRGGEPYYRHGSYGHGDRLVVVRDRYGRPQYYRYVDRGYDGYDRYDRYDRYNRYDRYDRYDRYGRYDRRYDDRRYGPPYGHAYGYYGKGKHRRQHCDSRGRCRVEYYDPRYDRHHDRRWARYPDSGWRYGDR